MGATATEAALTEFFIRKYNLSSRDAEYKKNRPTLQMMPRNGERLKMGDGFYVTVRIADGWSDSPDFASGMANYNVGTKIRWFVGDPYPQYGRLTFDGLMLARNNVGTIIDLKSMEADGVASNMLDSLEFLMWNDGTGKRGQISVSAGSAASRQWTLATVSDVYNFPIGTVLQANTAADFSGTTRADQYRVDSLDPINGFVFATRVVGAGGDVAANDFLFGIGSGGVAGVVSMPGIPTFIPAAAPTDTLYGVARTNGGPPVSGWRFPFVNSISETIQRSFATMGRWVNRAGAKYMVCLSTTDWLLLSLEREGRVIPDPTPTQTFGLEGLRVRTPYGPITAVAIPQLADGRGYILDWTTWTLYTLGNLPHVIDDDGKVFQRLAPGSPSGNNLNGDGIEMRWRIWKVLLCEQPMSNATFPTS
jgi:hypothetical protein